MFTVMFGCLQGLVRDTAEQVSLRYWAWWILFAHWATQVQRQPRFELPRHHRVQQICFTHSEIWHPVGNFCVPTQIFFETTCSQHRPYTSTDAGDQSFAATRPQLSRTKCCLW